MFFWVYFWPGGLWDPSNPPTATGDGTHTPRIEGEVLTAGPLGESQRYCSEGRGMSGVVS